MFILKLTHKGASPSEYLLTEDHDLWIGRNKDNFIVVKASYGISRRHLKLSKSDENSWKVECVSKLGGLLFKGKQVSECLIEDGNSFSLQDFHFELMLKPSEEQALSSNKEDQLLSAPPEEENPSSQEEKEKSEEEKKEENSENSLSLKKSEGEEQDSEDKLKENQKSAFEEAHAEPSMMTEAATVMTTLQKQLKPYLVISLSENETDQTAALEHGDKWIVGRDPSCEICVEDINISRQHFHITKKDDTYFITDLGSSNGTYVDDQLLKPRQPSPLKSGAVISVLEIEMYFEIRNPKVEKQITNLPAPIAENAPVPLQNDSENLPIASDAALPPAIHQPTPNVIMSETILTPLPPSNTAKKKRIFLIAALLAVIGVAFFLSQGDNTDKKQEDTSASDDPFRVLDPETQEQVKGMYTLAEQQYHMKKFELCYQTLEKMHALVPYYDQSKSLILTCQNGAESVRMQKDMEATRRKESENKKAMNANIEMCSSQFDTFQSMSELTECLHKATTIDPENSEIAFLISKFETKEMLKKERKLARLAQKKRVDVSLREYNKVKNLKTKDKVLKAIPAYKKFLNKKHPSSIKETVQAAQEELATMEEEVNSKTQTLLKKCQQLMDAKNHKEAYKVCREVFTVAPSHPTASAHIRTSIEVIQNTLKPIYNESVLNESLGQIEIAKKQWRSIMDQDIPNGEYYNKAEKKLSKY